MAVVRPLVRQRYLSADTVINNFTYAAYGGIHYSGPGASFPDMGASWQTIDVANTITLPNWRDLEPNIANASVTLATAGVYFISIDGSFEHDEAQGGRIVDFRIYDLVADAPVGNEFQVGIGRNTSTTNIYLATPYEVLVGSGNQELTLQAGHGDTVSGITFYTYRFSIHSIGLFLGPRLEE